MKQPKQKKDLTWVLKRAKPVLPGLAVLSAGYAVSAAIAVSFALVIKQVVDNAACGNFAAFVRAAVLYLVLLLDEATSALDEATETRLLQNLQADAGQKTVLIVTHRRAALALCSQVFEVKNGTLQKKINV